MEIHFNDKRLEKRYHLILAHMVKNKGQQSGISAPIDDIKRDSHTKNFYRFLHNDSVSIETLSDPVIKHFESAASEFCSRVILVAHDWSRIHLEHANKLDKCTMTHVRDVGYELQSSLAISDKNGIPIAPIAQNIITDKISYSSYKKDFTRKNHLDELLERIDYIEGLSHDKPLMHIIDREGDSAFHLRAIDSKNRLFLVRVNKQNSLLYNGKSLSAGDISQNLSFEYDGDIMSKGIRLQLHLAQCEVTLARKAKPSNKRANAVYKPPQEGESIPLRMVCSRLIDPIGEVVSEWYLLTNSNFTVNEIAMFYCYRWRIESFFKLLKSAGFDMEQWLQQTGIVFFKRVLLSVHACLHVWRLMHDESKEAKDFCAFLVRISGHQTKKSNPITATAVLHGFMVLLAADELLQQMSPQEIRQKVDAYKNMLKT